MTDPIEAAIEAAKLCRHGRPFVTSVVRGFESEQIEALRAQVEALRADAERWQHILKLPFQSVWQLFCVCISPIERNKAVDEAIDRAREA